LFQEREHGGLDRMVTVETFVCINGTQAQESLRGEKTEMELIIEI
jgi:hypothetical protein